MEATESKLETGNERMKSLFNLKKHAVTNSRKIFILGISGYDSSIFTIPTIEQLLKSNIDVIVIPDAQAEKAISEETLLKAFSGPMANSELIVLTNKDEWEFWGKSMVVLHIYLRNLVDGFLIAPMSPNVLAKMANGLCDDLLVTVTRINIDVFM